MGEGCVQSRHQPRTAHRWWHMHTQAHTQPAAAERRLSSSLRAQTPRAKRILLWVCGGGTAGAGNSRVGGREGETGREAGEPHP